MKSPGLTRAQPDAEARAKADAAPLAAAETEAEALNLQALRPLIAIQAGTATAEDRAKITEIEAKLTAVRTTIQDKKAKGGAS
jgi:hypothetical protein